jgi:hypothetical protein
MPPSHRYPSEWLTRRLEFERGNPSAFLSCLLPFACPDETMGDMYHGLQPPLRCDSLDDCESVKVFLLAIGIGSLAIQYRKECLAESRFTPTKYRPQSSWPQDHNQHQTSDRAYSDSQVNHAFHAMHCARQDKTLPQASTWFDCGTVGSSRFFKSHGAAASPLSAATFLSWSRRTHWPRVIRSRFPKLSNCGLQQHC